MSIRQYQYIEQEQHTMGRKKIYKVEVDGITFTMPNAVEVFGHDDTLPYNGTLYADGVPIADFWNDGWGGNSEYSIKDGMEEKFNEIKERITNYSVVGTDGYMPLPLTMDFLADICAYCQIDKFEYESTGDRFVKANA